MLHVIGKKLYLEILDRGDGTDEKKHYELDMLSMALYDTFTRNDLLKI